MPLRYYTCMPIDSIFKIHCEYKSCQDEQRYSSYLFITILVHEFNYEFITSSYNYLKVLFLNEFHVAIN